MGRASRLSTADPVRAERLVRASGFLVLLSSIGAPLAAWVHASGSAPYGALTTEGVSHAGMFEMFLLHGALIAGSLALFAFALLRFAPGLLPAIYRSGSPVRSLEHVTDGAPKADGAAPTGLMAAALLDANLVPAALYEDTRLIRANPAFHDLSASVAASESGARALVCDLCAAQMSAEMRADEVGKPRRVEIVSRDGVASTIGLLALRLSREPLRWLLIASDPSSGQGRERQMREAMLEIGHRSKNLMSVVQALARQIALTTEDWGTFEHRFGQRLAGLAASQDLLVNRSTGARMRELIHAQIAHLDDHLGSRVVLDGPDLLLIPSAAQTIGMAIHELSTNAVKYGALSNDAGRVLIRWSYDKGEDLPLVVSWTEEGGPPVEAPERRGFGWRVVAGAITRSLAGTVRYEFPRSGVEWALRLPPEALGPAATPQLRVVA